MKKKILFTFLALTFGVLFITPLASGKMTLKIGHVDKAGANQSAMEAFARFMKYRVETETGGEIEVMSYPGAQLGSMREMMESAKIGAIQMVTCYASVASMFCPKADLTLLPYIFPTEAHAYHVLDGWFGKELAEAFLKESGLRVIGYGEANGFRHFWTRKRPIHTLSDFKGMKLRTPESKILFKFIESVGGSPITVPYVELYTAVQTGMVDGFELELFGCVDYRIYEAVKYLTLTYHSYDTIFHVINESWFKKLPDKYKKIILDASRIGTVVSRGVVQNTIPAMVDIVRSKGLEIYVVKPEDTSHIAKVAKPACLKTAEETIGKEWVQKILRASKEAENALEFKGM
jgi:tripartite ATP-independent transporter DctP family solute receptor